MRRVKLDEGLYIGGEFEIIAGPPVQLKTQDKWRK